MSNLIADLLGVDRRDFARSVSRLEHMTLQPGVDARLTAEIITQTREKIRQLGLDPSDATQEELFYALQGKVKDDAAVLRSKLKITEKTKPDSAARKIARATESLLKKDIVVHMQASAVRKILKAVPPKKTMRALHFRSIDSVLKREDPLLLYALAKNYEDKTWHKQIQARLKRLANRDVHESAVSVLSLPKSWIEKLKSTDFDAPVESVPEIGSVLLLPSVPIEKTGSVILTIALVFQSAQKLAYESLPYRAQSLQMGLEKIIPDLASGKLIDLDPVHGLQPTWRAVYQLLSEQSRSLMPDFEFVLRDLQWESIETRMAMLASEFDFWVNSHVLGTANSEGVVSMHVVDVAANVVLEKKYEERMSTHLSHSLWNEVQVRYLKHEALERAIVNQLTKDEMLV